MSRRTAGAVHGDDRPVLITGATGFIGSHLATRLLATGVRVRALARHQEKAATLDMQGAEIVVGDLTAPQTLQRVCAGCRAVYHCAAWLGTPYVKDVAWAVNVRGTAALASAAVEAGVQRFVHLSSIAVYGPVRSGVITEDSPLWRGVELYGDSKIAAEATLREAAQHGLPVVIIRPGLVYGPGSRGWTLRFVEWIGKGIPAMVAGGFGLCWPVFIENLVDGLLLALDAPVVGHAFTLVDANLPWREFLGYYARMMNKSVRSVPLLAAYAVAMGDELRALLTPTPPRIRPSAVGYAVSGAHFSSDKATRLLGWVPKIAIPDAMRQTELWLKERGSIPA